MNDNMKTLFTISMAVFMLLFLIGCTTSGKQENKSDLPITKLSDNKENSQNSGINLLKMKISNMNCEGCAYGIKSMWNKHKAINKAEVEYPSGNAMVLYDTSKITANEIIGMIKPYEAIIISNQKGVEP